MSPVTPLPPEPLPPEPPQADPPVTPRLAPRPPLILLASATAVSTFSMHVFVPALPAAAATFGASPAQIQLTVTLYLIGLALGQMVHGPISDRIGRRPVILGGLALYLLGTIGAMLAPSLALLLVARVLQSVGSCAGLVVARAAVRETASGAGAAAGIAVLTTTVTLSSALAPLIGSTLNALIGWRLLFAALFCGAGVLTFLIYRRFAETNLAKSPTLSVPGMLRLYARLARMPAFLGFALGGATATVTAYGFYAALPFLLREELPGTANAIGFIYVGVVAGSILGALSAGRATRRLSLSRIALTGMSLAVAGAALFLLARAVWPSSVLSIVLPLFVMTFGGGFANPGVATLSMSVQREAIGAASSFYGFIQMATGAVVTLLVSLVGHDSASVGWITLGAVVIGFSGLCLGLATSRTEPD